MIIELGNTAAIRRERQDDGSSRVVGQHDDGIPRITTINIPDADDGSNHPDAEYKAGKLITPGPSTGGYTHEPGLTVQEFREHRMIAIDRRDGVTSLPGHEALLAVVAAWTAQSAGDPTWIEVTATTPAGQDAAADLEAFLHEFYDAPDRKPIEFEATHWTAAGPPGTYPAPPDITNLFTNVGRVLQANSMGGGQVGATGTGTAATGTTFTSASTWTTNQWAGYKIVVANTAGAMVWGNIKSNTNAAGASVATVDRWYTFATPGGAAGTTPANGYFWAILDGGSTSAWFVGLNNTNVSPAAADTSLPSEITTAGGGLIRKIAPFALTSGVSPMSYTLTPVFTANGSDTLPVTVYTIGVFNSIVSSDTVNTLMFHTVLSASATLSAVSDQVTVTETVTGS